MQHVAFKTYLNEGQKEVELLHL